MSNFYCFTDLIGGGAGALDARDGAELSDGDAALVVVENNQYHYFLDADSGLGEDSPFVIAPDDNPGTKRWILIDITALNTNAALSSMLLTGGEITDGTTPGTIKVAALTAMLRTGSGASDPLVRISLGEQDNVTLVAADIQYHILLTYGSPSTIATSGNSGNGANIIDIGHCLKEDDNSMHYSTSGLRLTDGVRKLYRRAVSLRDIEISSGGLVSDPGTRNLHITAGVFYRGINRFTTSAFDSFSSGPDEFEYYYWNPDGSEWIKDAGGPYTQIDNVQYNKVDSGSGLANLGSNKYTTNWVFTDPGDGHVLVLYGQSNTSLTAAENEEIPASLPDILDEMAVLLCKIILREGSDTLVFENVKFFTFTPQVTVDHNELQGLQGGQASQYEHLTSAEQTVAADLLTTGATAAELDELTDNSETALHSHASVFDGAFTDLTDVAEGSIDSADIGKVVKISGELELEFVDEDILDTAATASELDELTDSSETVLHSHADIVVRPMILTPQSSCGPAADFATHDTIAGGSTPAETVNVLDFDPDATEFADFKFALPAGYAGGGLTVTVIFSMTSDHDEGAHEVRWEVGFARIDDDGIAISADHAYAFNGVSAAVPSVVSEVSYDDITFTDGADMDSLAAGEMAILRIRRKHDHGDDNATGDAELQMIKIRET